jgi:branched-chain amino acid transport system ATP-binding protein
MPLLEVRGLTASYGASQALFGIDLSVEDGQFVTLIGRNGMGKSTIVRSIIGLMRNKGGHVRMDGEDISHEPPYRIARRGIGLVPEMRQVFPTLTVRENLIATAARRSGGPQSWTLDRIYALFPQLAERTRHLGASLSGGEQQMVAIGRALMTNPRLLMLDEATEGLAPLLRAEIWRCLEALKAGGLAMIVVDKNIGSLKRLADRHFVVEKGTVAWSGSSAELSAQPEVLQRHVGI